MLTDLKRRLTTSLIHAGPNNPLAMAIVNLRCRQFGASLARGDSNIRRRKEKQEIRLAPEHFAYAPDIAKNFEINFSPLVPGRDGDLKVLDFSKPGTLQTYADSGLQFEMVSLPEEASAIEDYFRWYTPVPGDLVFDIGAHCGVSTYHFSKLVGSAGRVIAFEPDPRNFPFLLRNIERHCLTNVIALPMAISSKTGEESFNSEGATGSGLARHIQRATTGRAVNVPALSLRDAFATYGVPQFCKIDIEGAEVDVVSAAREVLGQERCEFVLDTSHIVDGEETASRIEDIFRSCGYQAESSHTGMTTTWARPGSKEREGLCQIDIDQSVGKRDRESPVTWGD